MIKEKWEGRQPKTRDKYGSLEKNKFLHPRNKVGRSSTDITNMDSEVEVFYLACKCRFSILCTLECTEEQLFIVAVEK